MLLKILGYIPFLQSATYFPWSAHKTAAKKFCVLFLLTSLPVIVAAILSPVPAGEEHIIAKLGAKLSESISVSEQFVYTASFLTPILYIIFEKYHGSNKVGFNQKISQSFKIVFKGYGFIALVSLIIIIFTAVAFSSLKTDAQAFSTTFLNQLLVEYSTQIYLFALFCWYLSLLDGCHVDDYVEQSRASEKDLSSAFAARIKERGN